VVNFQSNFGVKWWAVGENYDRGHRLRPVALPRRKLRAGGQGGLETGTEQFKHNFF